MRIAIDLQGAQNDSKNRGIGRYSLSLAQAIARQRGNHEVLILLSGAFADTIDEMHAEFCDLIPSTSIRIFNPEGPTHTSDAQNIWRRNASEILYEHFLSELQPDVVIVCSPLDGWADQTISSFHKTNHNFIIAPILHDLIPLIQHIQGDLDWPQTTLAWYMRKIDDLRRADCMLANSESSKSEAILHLGFPSDQITNISAAADKKFHPVNLEAEEVVALKARYSIADRFVLTSSAIEQRKNPEHLIRAFSFTPESIRKNTQLVFIGKFTNPYYKAELQRLAEQCGLSEGDLIFSGFVPDDDLIQLYAVCNVFVFPSLHEGFGLPALEAMACGAPTIASNATSLPEVMGWDEALFDPHDPQAIARSIERVLTDESFRRQLIDHGLQQAQKFSWDRSARTALDALESAYANREIRGKEEVPLASLRFPSALPRLAYFSPLSSARSGIADYSAELLPELSRYYAIDVVVAQEEPIQDAWVLGNANIRSVTWFEQHAHSYDRILYHFGNSEYHAHLFDLLERFPGAVVLHDFYLSGVIGWVLANKNPGAWDRALLHSHGWQALVSRHQAKTQQDIVNLVTQYPCNLQVLQQAQGIIVHSPYSLCLADQWYGADMAADWAVIPHLRVPIIDAPREQARTELGLEDDTFLVCSFGLLGETKLNHRLIEAWASSSLAKDPRCRLVFVGKLPDGGDYATQLQVLLKSVKGRITVTGWADGDIYKRYLAAADLAVQLRTQSRGETSGTVLDCMNFGLPTIVNANGSMADLPIDVIYSLPDDFSTVALSEALDRLHSQPALRHDLGQRAAAHIRSHHLPRVCADQYAQAIERFHIQAEKGAYGLIKRAQYLGLPPQPEDLISLAERAAQIYPPRRPPAHQLLLDISELAQHDAKTGIQRVVRSVLQELLQNPPDGYRIEPIYATKEHGYRYARRFTARFLGIGEVSLDDEPIYATSGDVFFAPDWAPDVVRIYEKSIAALRLNGVKVIFYVHDILPLTLPQTTHPFVHEAHMHWLQVLTRVSSGLLCNSATVMSDVKEWLSLFGPQAGHAIPLGWSHLGSDVFSEENNKLFQPGPEQSAQLAAIRRFPAFLMVGTLEPRKGHAQVVAAFELLWAKGVEVNLVIVGKQGWMVDELAEHLRTHSRRERNLFWLQGIDDGLLEQLYAASSCLIAASLDEGFGLPLIEAARHKLPILARDIPVFREVAGEHASYFSGFAPQDLVDAIQQWLEGYQTGKTPKSDTMPWLTWAESTRQMLNVILNDQWQDNWAPVKDVDLMTRHWGSDYRVQSIVGERIGKSLWSTGRPGHLAYGPKGLSLMAGSYVVTWKGHVGPRRNDDGAHADIAIQQGTNILAHIDLHDFERDDGSFSINLPFTLKEARQDVEARIWVGETSDIRLDLLEIRKAAPEAAHSSAELPRMAGAKELESSGIHYHYWATHPKMHMNVAVGHSIGRSVYATGKKGYLVHGPYIGIPMGKYVAKVYGVAPEAGLLGGSWMDVVWNKGNETSPKKPLQSPQANTVSELARIAFELPAYTPNIEVRVYVQEGISVRIDGIVLEE